MPDAINGQVEVLGAYRVTCTREMLRQRVEDKYGKFWNPLLWLLARREVRKEIESAVLIELRIPQPNAGWNTDRVRQEGSSQAAYDEHFLSDDGEKTIETSWPRLPEQPWTRMGFFFHFFDETKSLQTSFGPVRILRIDPMPTRLAKLMPYEAVD